MGKRVAMREPHEFFDRFSEVARTGRALETLIARGWIRRKKNEQDRRQNLLELTAAGERARKKVQGARDQIVRRIAAALDERDLKDFERIAGKILAELGGG